MALVLLLGAVTAVLLEAVQPTLYDRDWVAGLLGRPLPTRVLNSLGRWRAAPVNDTSTNSTLWVKFSAATLTVEEVDAKTAPTCSKEEEKSGCFVWEADPAYAAPGGIAALAPRLPPTWVPPAKPITLSVGAVFQTGESVDSDAFALRFATRWNDTATATGVDGEARWLAFGVRQSFGTQALRKIFPAEGGSDDDVPTDDPIDDGGEEDGRGFMPAARFFRGRLDSVDALRLFGNLYHRRKEEDQKAKRKKGRTEREGVADTRSLTDLFSSQCFWLTEVVYSDLEAGGGEARARAWSTCGARLTWTTTTKSYTALVGDVSLFAVAGLVLVAAPAMYGAIHQRNWMLNSRTRYLRVNPYQLILSALAVILATDLSSRNPQGTATALTLAVRSSKATFVLHSALYMTALVLFHPFFLVNTEFLNYFRASEDARGHASQHVGLFFIVIIFGPSLMFFGGQWLTGLLAGLFWVPQLIHCLTMDGWTGLTAPFVLSNLVLIAAPTARRILPPAPWGVPQRYLAVELVGLAVMAVTSGMLMAFWANAGKNLLPGWLAPWRHTYRTTPEAERAALLENPQCPICRNALEEGWDDNDELWRTPCRHLFHKSCLERWMQERTECPLCRKLLPEP